MVKTKKVFSIILALILVLTTCAFSAFAWTGTGAQEMKIEAIADKTVVNPGDEVKVTIKLYKSDTGTWGEGFGGYNITWFYNTALISSTSTIEYSDVYKKFSMIKPVSSVLTAKAVSDAKALCTPEEQARFDANGYNGIFKFTCVKDRNTEFGQNGYWKWAYPDGLEVATLTFKISDTVKAGDIINLDMMSGLFGRQSFVQTVDTTTLKGTNKNGSEYYDFSKASVTLTVGTPAPAGPAVSKAKSQVKMTATSATTVADEFSFRVISKISDSDWDTYFKNTGVAGATTDYITAVGMVAYKGAAAFDAETAKRVVAGESVTDYTAASTDYISKVSDTADAEFGAIIKANHSTLNNDVTYMGFVKYVDASGNAQTIFYETAGTAALSTNYDNIVSKYLAAYPFA